MAVSTYDNAFLNETQRAQLAALTEEWNRANAAGDQAGMDGAHAAAERIRAGGGYAGGDAGTGYTQNPTAGGYTASTLPTYRARTDEVNRLYDAAREMKLAQLKTAYDTNLSTLEAAKAKLPEQYQAQRNAVAANSELQRNSFHEYAAAAGLNTGAAGQAELARANTLQGNLTSLRKSEAEAMTDAENKIAQLKTAYQNEVAAAIAQGEYERAAALMEEYRMQEQSAVSVAQAQAGENYRAYSTEYAARQDAENARLAAEAEDYDRAMAKAKLLAQYGDFSGFSGLGYDQNATDNMRAVWIAQNPDLAYYTGAISESEWLRRTGGGTGSGSGSGGGSSSGGASGPSFTSPYQAMYDSGIRSEGEAYAWLLANGYKSADVKNMIMYYNEYMKQQARGTGGNATAPIIKPHSGAAGAYNLPHIQGVGDISWEQAREWVNAGYLTVRGLDANENPILELTRLGQNQQLSLVR